MPVVPGAWAVNVSVNVPDCGAPGESTAGETAMADRSADVACVSAGSGGTRARTCRATRCDTPIVRHAAAPTSMTPVDAGTVADTSTGITVSACAAPTGACADGDDAAQGAGVDDADDEGVVPVAATPLDPQAVAIAIAARVIIAT